MMMRTRIFPLIGFVVSVYSVIICSIAAVTSGSVSTQQEDNSHEHNITPSVPLSAEESSASSCSSTNDSDDDKLKEQSRISKEILNEEYDLPGLVELLQCHQQATQPSPIHTDREWKFLQEAYLQVLWEEYDDIESVSSIPSGGYVGLDGFYVPRKVQHGEHGRGVYYDGVEEDVEEGTVVWRSFNTARFESGATFRRYLQVLYDEARLATTTSSSLSSSSSAPQQLACDVLMWAYTRLEFQAEDQSIHVVACVDLDPGSFVNGCDNAEDCNLALMDESGATGCRLEFYASQSIEPGEEFRIDYSFSELSHGWAALNLNHEVPSILTILREKQARQQAQQQEHMMKLYGGGYTGGAFGGSGNDNHDDGDEDGNDDDYYNGDYAGEDSEDDDDEVYDEL